MKILDRYLMMECGLSAMAALGIFTLLVLLPKFLVLVDLWVNKGVGIEVLLEMTLLIIPKLMVGSLPMAMLLGIMLPLGRLSQDSEIVVMKAGGVGLYQILKPVAMVVVAFAFFAMVLNWYWVPQTRHAFFQINNALISATTLSFHAQSFNQSVPNLSIYVNEKGRDDRSLRGILIHDRRNPQREVTIVAELGRLYQTNSGSTALYLFHGSQHFKLDHGVYRRMDFEGYDLNLEVVEGLRSQPEYEDMVTFSLDDLEAAMKDSKPSRVYAARMEWHRRLAMSAATLILGMLATPLGIQSHRAGRGYGVLVAIAILVVHFLLITMGEAAARNRTVDPIMGFWLPNLFMGLMAAHVIHLAARERPFRPAVWLASLLSALPEKLLRSRTDREGG